ncbi:MAG TPA: GrdX protein, partial [Clostridium sp.]|nr:GrdX protein [Clostridium sp.]
MIEPLFIITNNPLSKRTFETKYKIVYIDGS